MLDNFNSKQKRIIVTVGLIILIGVLYFIYNNIGQTDDKMEDIIVQTKAETDNNEINTTKQDEDIIIIHITGEVKKPGIVKLPEGSRIEDAIQAAEGLTENADISNVNLAYVIDDGSKITIPKLSNINEKEEDIINKDSGENIVDLIQENNPSKTEKININKATTEQLQNLPGIGESTALKIIEYRDKNGKFKNIEEIKNVNGIGENKYDKIKEHICVK